MADERNRRETSKFIRRLVHFSLSTLILSKVLLLIPWSIAQLYFSYNLYYLKEDLLFIMFGSLCFIIYQMLERLRPLICRLSRHISIIKIF